MEARSESKGWYMEVGSESKGSLPSLRGFLRALEVFQGWYMEAGSE